MNSSNRKTIKLVLSNEQQTQYLADSVSEQIKAAAEKSGLTLGLMGDLGGGKTTFTRYLCNALGSLIPVSSPTFVLSYEYQTNSRLVVEHWDLYRLHEPPFELLEPPGAGVLRVVEWIDKFPELVIQAEIILRFALIDNISRDTSLELQPGLDPEGVLEEAIFKRFATGAK